MVAGSSRQRPPETSGAGAERDRAGAGVVQRVAELPSALERAREILARLASRPAVFLDFDGTLAPIVARPADARLPAGNRAELERLAAQVPVGILSGRDLEDLRTRVGLPGLHYAGSHGFEMLDPDGVRHDHPEAAARLPHLAAAEEALGKQLGGLRGVLIERKRFSLAVHVRLAGEAEAAAAERAVAAVLGGLPELRCTPGRRVHDLQPNLEWHKGLALQRMLARIHAAGGPPRHPLYIGDDLTDEDAFRALRGSGVAIVVRGGLERTAAEYVLRDPGEVGLFLAACNRLLAQTGDRIP